MTHSFLTPLQVEYINGCDWKLTEGFSYFTDINGIGEIRVPKNFVTDFASIPRGLWNIFPPTGKWAKAAVIHDWCYRMTDLDRKTCDDILLEGMEVLGVNWFSRKAIYRAVRIFGCLARKQTSTIDKNPEI